MKQVNRADQLKTEAKKLKMQLFALIFALVDKRTPFLLKLFGGLIIAYAVSPIDLIPDFIPVIGFIDDLILIPTGLRYIHRKLPPAVLADAQAKAGKPEQYGLFVRLGVVLVSLWFAFVVGALLWGVLFWLHRSHSTGSIPISHGSPL